MTDVKKSAKRGPKSPPLPYREPAPRPLYEDELPEPKVKKPMNWIVKTFLFLSPAVLIMYTHAWLTDYDHALLKGHIGNTNSIVMFFAILGLLVAAIVCAFTKGRFR